MRSFKKILQTQQFVGGEEVLNFERKFAKFLDVKHAVSCNSGTDGLWLALKALDLKKNSIVLTTPFSFIASCSEIVAHGAHPVFIDVDPDTFNICPLQMKMWLEKNTTIKGGETIHKQTGLTVSGIVSVDLFGQCADYVEIKKIANEWNLWIVEDACQAIGAELEEKKAGNFGDVGVFSFYPTKNFGALGDGGCCVTNDSTLAERLMSLKNHGRKTHYHYQELGINSRLDGLQAAALSVKLNYIDYFNEQRRAIAQYYEAKLSAIDFISLPKEKIGKHVYHQYSIKIKDSHGHGMRDILSKQLAFAGIHTVVFYPQTFTQIGFLNTHSDLVNECPVAESLTQNILSLPIWPEVEEEEICSVCDAIRSFPIKTLRSTKVMENYAAR